MKIEKYCDFATVSFHALRRQRLDSGTSSKRVHNRSVSNQKRIIHNFPSAFPKSNDCEFAYGKNDSSALYTHSKNPNWTNYPSQKEAIRSRLKTIYNKKKCSTANNFFKIKKTAYGLSSFISKYAVQERGPPDRDCERGLTIEQYFVEMEKRLACNSNLQHNGKRAISTALPASRQHYANRERSGEHKESKVLQEYSLGPIQLTRVRQPKLPRVNGNAEEGVAGKEELDEVKLEQQRSRGTRPDSRYNKESICSSLDHVAQHASPMLSSWNRETSKRESRLESAKNISRLGKELPLTQYGLYGNGKL